MSDLQAARVCVVGGAGFVGSHVVDLLVREPVREVVVFDNFVRGRQANLQCAMSSGRVRVVHGDITQPKELTAAVANADFVIHLAALWLLECLEEPRAAFEVNVCGTFNVIEACSAEKVKKLVFSSSASVYGDAVEVPMMEAHPFNNRTLYGATKIAGEQLLQAFHHTHGLPFAALRYMNVYGPRQDDRGAYTSVIMKVLDRIDCGLPPVIFGDGTATYDFVYVEDVALANVLAITRGAPAGFYNIGSGVATTVRELVQEILDLTGSSLRPEYRPEAQVLVQRRIASVALACKDLGFKAEVPLKGGLEKLIAWRNREKAANTL